MPQIVVCPQCESKLRVPDNLMGKTVRCPGCRTMFKTTAPKREEPVEELEEEPIEDPIEEPEEEPAGRRSSRREERVTERPSRRRSADRDDEEEDEDDDRPRRRRRDEEDEYEEEDDEDYDRGPRRSDPRAGWNKVRIGINLVMIGLWSWIGSVVLGFLGLLLALLIVGMAALSGSARGGLASLGFGGILALLSLGLIALGGFAHTILQLVGYGMCMGTPGRGSGGLRPLAITAFSLAAAATLFNIATTVMNGFTNLAASIAVRGGGGIAGTILNVLFLLCAFASFVVWLVYLRNVCRAVRARHLEGTPMAVLIAFIIFGVVAFLILVGLGCAGGMAIASAAQSGSGKGVGAWAIIMVIVIGLLGLVYLGLTVWYIFVLQKIRDAVASYRRRA